MVVLTAETCWALNEYWINNKISGIKLVSLYSTIRIISLSWLIIKILSGKFKDKNREVYLKTYTRHSFSIKSLLCNIQYFYSAVIVVKRYRNNAFLLFYCNKVTRTPFNMALYAHLSFSLNFEMKSVISHYFTVHLRLALQLMFISRRNATWKLWRAFELHWYMKYISSLRYIHLYIPTFYDHGDESSLFWPIVKPFSLSLLSDVYSIRPF